MTVTLLTPPTVDRYQVWIQPEGEGISPLDSQNSFIVGVGNTERDAWKDAQHELGEALNLVTVQRAAV